MSDGEILNELRRLSAEDADIDERSYRRLMLASMADLFERWNRHMQEPQHTHPEMQAQIDSLKRRDLGAYILGGFSMLGVAIGWILKK